MRFDFHYRRENVVDVDAAVVGVSRLRWVSLAPDEANDLDRARQIMSEHQFDLMPVDADGEEVRSYIKSKRWGRIDEGVELHDIAPQDIIPQRTPFEEVIRGFALHERDFYFLSNYGRITGLITIVNLNCRQARVFLYGLICEAETAMGELIRGTIDTGSLTPEAVLDVLSENRTDVREGFAAAAASGVEPDVTEFLYLTDLTKVVRTFDLYEPMGYENRAQFKREFAHLNETRIRVAHPTRSLIESREGVKSLWADIEVVERALSHIHRYDRSL